MKFYKLLVKLFILLLLLTGAAAFFLYSSTGLQLAVNAAMKYTPGALVITGARGYLQGPITIDKVTYDYKMTHITATKVILHWQSLDLLVNNVLIPTIKADEFIYRVSRSTNDTPFDYDELSLPIKININQGYADHAALILPSPAHSRFHLDANGNIAIYVDHFSMQGHTNAQQFLFEHIQWHALEGEWQAGGKIMFKPRVEWFAQVLAHTINPKNYGTHTSGNLQLALASHGTVTNDDATTGLNLYELKGELGHKKITGSMYLGLFNEDLTQFNSQLQFADTTIDAEGKLGSHLNMHWRVHIPNLGLLIPASHGSLVSEGNVSGSRAAPQINITAQAQALQFLQDKINRLEGKAVIDLRPNAYSQVHVQGDNILWNNLAFDHVAIQGQGQTQQQTLTITLARKAQQLQLGLIGDYEQAAWQGLINKLMVITPGGRWQLNAPAPVQFSKTNISIKALCLHAAQSSVCGELQLVPQQAWSAKLNAKHVAIENFSLWLPDPLKISNTFDLAGAVNVDAHHQINATIATHISSGALTYPMNNQTQSLGIRQGAVNVVINNKGLNTQARIDFSTGENLTGALNLPGYLGRSWPTGKNNLAGNLSMIVPHLKLLPSIFPQLRNTDGQLSAQVLLTGTVNQPDFKGDIKLERGSAEVPQFGLKLKNIQASLAGLASGGITINASLLSGAGKLALSGTGLLSNHHFTSTLTLQGSQVQVSNTDDIKIEATPHLILKTQDDNLWLSGNILIPTANITPKYFGSTVVEAEDVIIVKDGKPVNQETHYNLTSRIDLSLGEKVHFAYKGIDSYLAGHLTISDTPDSPSTATGVLFSKKGTYKTHGQVLTVRQGRLLFAGGPITNPALDIQAIKKVNTPPQSFNYDLNTTSFNNDSLLLAQNPTITLGVNIQNTLKKPIITLFSEPAGLSQADILSYLLLDRPVASLNKGDSKTLLSAASALNLGGGTVSNLTQQIANAFGLNELSIESEPLSTSPDNLTQNTSLVLGKYFTPRLYVNYSIGLLEPVNTFRVRYKVSKHWMVQGESSALANGLDLFYTIERK